MVFFQDLIKNVQSFFTGRPKPRRRTKGRTRPRRSRKKSVRRKQRRPSAKSPRRSFRKTSGKAARRKKTVRKIRRRSPPRRKKRPAGKRPGLEKRRISVVARNPRMKMKGVSGRLADVKFLQQTEAKKALSIPSRKTKLSPAAGKAAFATSQPRPSKTGPFVAEVTHYFPKIMVGVLKMHRPLSVGDTVRIQGKTNGFVQSVRSLQIESVNVKSAGKGQLVGLKVAEVCRPGDMVYLINNS